MMNRKKKAIVLLQNTSGCTYHRLILPNRAAEYLLRNSDEYEIQVGLGEVNNSKELITKLLEYDIVIYHNSIEDDVYDAIKGKVTTICDIDDYWNLNQSHIAKDVYPKDTIIKNISRADYVTTTTELLASHIRLLNKNVLVFPNALTAEGQFAPKNNPHKRIVIAVICSASHTTDMQLLESIDSSLPKDIKDKIQLRLCGFDKGLRKIYDENDKLEKVEDLPWVDNPWFLWECYFTDSLHNLSRAHQDHLMKFDREYEYYDEDEPYMRRWAKPIENYASLYDDVDILLVPLVKNSFSVCKSPLKFVEASVKKCAVIASDCEPYSSVGINIFDKGGSINPEGNCILVPENKGIKGFAKAITRFVNNKEARELSIRNLSKLTEEGAEYNLMKVAEDRIKFYKQIWDSKER